MLANGTSHLVRLVHVSTEESTAPPALFIPFPGGVGFLTICRLRFNCCPSASDGIACGELDRPTKLRDMGYFEMLTQADAMMECRRFVMGEGRCRVSVFMNGLAGQGQRAIFPRWIYYDSTFRIQLLHAIPVFEKNNAVLTTKVYRVADPS